MQIILDDLFGLKTTRLRSVRRLIESRPSLRLDRVHFQAFGESSLDFEVVYFVTTTDYGLYMDEQQRLNLQMMREFAWLGVEFAIPARTLRVMTPDGQRAAARELATQD